MFMGCAVNGAARTTSVRSELAGMKRWGAAYGLVPVWSRGTSDALVETALWKLFRVDGI